MNRTSMSVRLVILTLAILFGAGEAISKGKELEHGTASLTFWKMSPTAGKQPVKRGSAIRYLDRKLWRIKGDAAPERVPSSEYTEKSPSGLEGPMEFEIGAPVGTYLLTVEATYAQPFSGKKRFKILPQEKGMQNAPLNLVLHRKPFSICHIRIFDKASRQPLSGLRLRAFHQGKRHRVRNWKSLRLFKQGKPKEARQLPSGIFTDEDGKSSFTLWNDIDRLEFRTSARRIDDGGRTFTLERKELLEGATVFLPVRPISLIVHPYVLTKSGEQKKLTPQMLQGLTPNGYGKKRWRWWALSLYKRSPGKNGGRSPNGNPIYDKQEEAFIWRLPYPSPGQDCILDDHILLDLPDKRLKLLLAKQHTFTIPEDIPLEMQVTIVPDSAGEKMPTPRSGQVITPQGDPVSGAHVILRNKVSRQTWRVVTDAKGKFKETLRPGNYTVRIVKHGYTALETRWRVHETKEKQKFEMLPKSKLLVHVENGEGRRIEKGIICLIPENAERRARQRGMREGTVVFNDVLPGRYTVTWGVPPGKLAAGSPTHFMYDRVTVKPGKTGKAMLRPAKNIVSVRLRLDRGHEKGNVIGDQPVMLVLNLNSKVKHANPNMIVLGNDNSVELKLPVGTHFKPELILGSAEENDRFENATAYYTKEFTVPVDSEEGKLVHDIDLALEEDTKHTVDW